MARKCEICGKGHLTGYNVSHANNKTKKRSYPNLQTIKIKRGGTVMRAKICTRCIRSGAIEKAA